MRQVILGLGLGTALVSCGCSGFVPRGNGDNGTTAVRFDTRQPTTAGMVAYLNDNARRIQGLQCEVTLDAKGSDGRGGTTSGVVGGTLDCQKPRNFRLMAKAAGQPMVDIGSNDTEFWFWIAKANPAYVNHCSWQDLNRGGVPLPFPFQPDMILAALGMGEYNPQNPYEMKVTPRTIELIESTRVQGQPVKKITVFDRNRATANQPLVIAHVLRDANGRDICSATISEVRYDRASGAVVPRRVRLVCPREQVELKMKLDDIRIGVIRPQLVATLFSRQNLSRLTSYDLAQQRVDSLPQGQGELQRVGGQSPR
jgi:hypothetical protein